LEKTVVDPNFLIPVFVNLSDLEGPANDMVENAFLPNGLTQMDLEALKAHKVDRFFLLLMDSRFGSLSNFENSSNSEN
jgi:hypothetical protein